MFPLALVAAVVAVFALRRRASDGATSTQASPSSGGSSSSTSTSGGVTWLDAWGTPNAWDRKYPNADPKKPIPYDPADLDPTFRGKLDAAFADLRAQGFDPKVYEGARSQHRQAYLYGQGRTDFPVYGRTGNKVTYTLDASSHGRSPVVAVDVVSASKWWEDMNFFHALGTAVKKQGLTWGGDWTNLRDYPHVEFKG